MLTHLYSSNLITNLRAAKGRSTWLMPLNCINQSWRWFLNIRGEVGSRCDLKICGVNFAALIKISTSPQFSWSRMGVLMSNLTQNIDNLFFIFGMDISQVIQAHGSYSRVYCANCNKDADFEQFEYYVRILKRCLSLRMWSNYQILFLRKFTKRVYFVYLSEDLISEIWNSKRNSKSAKLLKNWIKLDSRNQYTLKVSTARVTNN